MHRSGAGPAQRPRDRSAILKLILLIVPLGLDTFAVSAALGLRGLDGSERLRLSLVFAAFEAGMPLLGMLIGRAVGGAIGSAADYVAIAILAAVGIWMLLGDEETDRLADRRGLGLLALGVSVSLDELAMGFGIGLLGLSILVAVVLIGAQAFLLSQLGARLGERGRGPDAESAERAAALALLALAGLLLVERVA